jgi:protein-S-isoprenylcysteine O-methyltransferase Ste14
LRNQQLPILGYGLPTVGTLQIGTATVFQITAARADLLGVLLAASALVLLGHTAVAFSRDLVHAALPGAIVSLLDRLLLVLMIVALVASLLMLRDRHPAATATRA